MNNAAYKRWTGTEWWLESYERLWTPLEAGITDNAGRDSQTAQEDVIYLTADSDEELLELKEGQTYIIGGICDHNRYKVSATYTNRTLSNRGLKNLCRNKAADSKIRTARLPIGRFLASLTTRKILTVNQVFEILVKWVETRDWELAMQSIIPKRKFDNDGREELENNDAADEDEIDTLEKSD